MKSEREFFERLTKTGPVLLNFFNQIVQFRLAVCSLNVEQREALHIHNIHVQRLFDSQTQFERSLDEWLTPDPVSISVSKLSEPDPSAALLAAEPSLGSLDCSARPVGPEVSDLNGC